MKNRIYMVTTDGKLHNTAHDNVPDAIKERDAARGVVLSRRLLGMRPDSGEFVQRAGDVHDISVACYQDAQIVPFNDEEVNALAAASRVRALPCGA